MKRGNTDEILLFGYGSLMYEPERSDALIERVPARLPGWRRAFNKRSVVRGCPRALARHGPLDGFLEDDTQVSLVLGLEPGDGLDGMVLRYPAAIADDLLARMHAREGWAPDRPERENSYVPRHLTVQTRSGPVRALAWVTNPASRRYVALALEQQARVLRHATPVRSPDGRARGADYLRGVGRALDAVGVRDPYVDDLIAAVEALG